MKETPKNIVASIHARLKNEAVRQRKPFAEILQYYAMERFLYRFSKSKYADKFILKGGLLFYVWSLALRRPTKDIDFRGYVENNPESIAQVVRDILLESVADDGITFDLESIKTERTQIDADYEGIRVKFSGYLGRARIAMQLDVGFSDEITSKAEPIDYPGLLPDQNDIRVKSYPKESVVSEKFHAMVHHAELNSRWKDYYDIWLISETFDFESSSIQRAIEKTFQKRDTELSAEKPPALTADFATKNQTRWMSFITKSGLKNPHMNNFVEVIERIWIFLEYPILVSFDKTKPNRSWTPKKGWK